MSNNKSATDDNDCVEGTKDDNTYLKLEERVFDGENLDSQEIL